jgi:hypothetical protein
VAVSVLVSGDDVTRSGVGLLVDHTAHRRLRGGDLASGERGNECAWRRKRGNPTRGEELTRLSSGEQEANP